MPKSTSVIPDDTTLKQLEVINQIKSESIIKLTIFDNLIIKLFKWYAKKRKITVYICENSISVTEPSAKLYIHKNSNIGI